MGASNLSWTNSGRERILEVCEEIKVSLQSSDLPSVGEANGWVVRPHGTGVLVTHPRFRDRLRKQRREG